MSVAEKLTAIADAIRTYAREPLGKLTLDDMAKNIPAIYNIGVEDGEPLGFEEGKEVGIEQGKKDAYDEFWDSFQINGTRTNYVYSFGCGWKADIFRPKHPLRPVNANYMFFNNIADCIEVEDFVEFCDEHNIVLDFSECTSATYALATIRSSHFGILDFRKCTKLGYLFYGHTHSRSVHKIDEFKSSEITAFENSTFQAATYLTDITMSGVVAKSINFGTCPLNEASVRSVVSVLSPTATGQTVTFKGSSKALFSDADWAELITPISNQYDGNWTVAITA